MNKETMIEWIDLMLGLSKKEKDELYNMEMRKIEFRFKLALTEKTDEMIG